MKAETRIYPQACTSMFCGEITCRETCPHKAALEEFKAWRAATNAKETDPIYGSNVFVAQAEC